MVDMYAIYGSEATGVNGEYEATGEVHYYCTENHAERHAIAQGFRSSANYSKPAPNTDAIPGTKCEWCGAQVVPDKKKKPTANDVGNQFGYICPACSSGEHLEICALVWVALSPDGSDPGEAWDGSHEWTEKSAVTCRACAWSGLVKDLKKTEVEG